MYFSAFTSIIAFLAIVGVFGLLIYLIVQALKAKKEPIPAPIRRSPLSRPSDGYNDGPNLNVRANMQSVPAQPIFDPYKDIPVKNRTWDISVLREIEWKRFETVCTEYLRMAGYVAQETNVGADGGVDIRVSKPGEENFRGIVQCKAWNAYKVGVKPIRELFGIMAAERISTGIFITSGEFTSEAEEFAKGKITLVWGEKLINLINRLPEDKRNRLLDITLEGDYRTPTCPQCDIKMALRESSKGRNAGGQFWGCVRYPRCKQTLIYKEAV